MLYAWVSFDYFFLFLTCFHILIYYCVYICCTEEVILLTPNTQRQPQEDTNLSPLFPGSSELQFFLFH